MSKVEEYRRITIGPMTRDIKQQGLPLGPINLALPQPDHDNFTIWSTLKPEAYAISAIFIDQVIDKALASRLTRNPTDIRNILRKTPQRFVDMFTHLQNYTQSALYSALDSTIADYAAISQTASADNPEKRLYDRFYDLTLFNVEHIYRGGRKDSKLNPTAAFILRGINTAAPIMARFLEAIPEVQDEQGKKLPEDPLVLKGVADRSYPFLTKFSNQHQDEFESSTAELQDGIDDNFVGYFNPDKFTLKETPKGLSVVIKDDERQVDHKIHYSSNISTQLPLVGCPARVVIDINSSIKKLWDWHVDMAPTIYAEYFEQLVNPIPAPLERENVSLKELLESFKEMLKDD